MAEKTLLAKGKPLYWILVTGCFILTLISVKSNNRAKYNSVNEKLNINWTLLVTVNEEQSKNWTLLLTVNDGYFDFFQNWIHFYRKLNLNYSLIVIAEDDIVFFKLQKLDGNLITLVRGRRNTLSKAVDFGSRAFSELASGRPFYILKCLQNGVNIVYADLDAVWLRNPFPYFNGNYEIWMQSDGRPGNLCTGLIAVKSSRETIKLMQEWKASLNKHLQIDQYAFNKVVNYSQVRLKTLDMKLFPPGKLYFQEFNDEQRNNVVIVHNNWIVGHRAKLQRFKSYKLWFS